MQAQEALPFDRRAIPDAARESVWQAADGHAIRLLDWAEPDAGDSWVRGSILFMPGRGDAYEKYLDTYEDWRRRGWRVSAADWRGQAGSGRLGSDSTTGHIDDFDSWIADLAALWSEWARGREGPLVLAGHSMGGHLVLRTAGDGKLAPKPDALILSAPMLAFLPEGVPWMLQRGLAGMMSTIGNPHRPAWKYSEKPGTTMSARQKLLTHDDDRYADEGWWKRQRPELVMGPGSWGWIRAALDSIAVVDSPGYLEALDVPVFIVATSQDRLVGPQAIQRAHNRLPDSELLMLGEEARHEVLREVDPVRDRILAAIDSFLDSKAPAQAK